MERNSFLFMSVVYLSIYILVMGLITIFLNYLGWEKNEILNLGIFVATSLLCLVTYTQLLALRQQATASFLLKFNNEFFFHPKNQEIIAAIEDNSERIKKGEKTSKILQDNEGQGGQFTDYELDDYLSYFELIDICRKKGLLDFDDIFQMFGHYISLTWNNEEIREYINNLPRKYDSSDNDPRYLKPVNRLACRVDKLAKKYQYPTGKKLTKR